MNIFKTNYFAPRIRPNILPEFCDFETPHTWNVVSGTGGITATTSNLMPYDGLNSTKINVVSDGVATKTATISASSTQMQTTIATTGDYAIALMLGLDSTQTFIFGVEVWINGIKTEFKSTFTSDMGLRVGQNPLSQTLSLETGDVVDFKFAIESKYSRNFYIDGFKLELIDDNIYLPSVYSRTEYLKLLWQSRVDTTNTQNILADTNTNFGFNGTSESNDTITLLTTTGLITPSKEKAVVAVDYAFNFDAPSGADRFVDIFVIVNSVTYRGETYTMTKNAGDTEYISGSFTLPVGVDFKQYGAQIVINSSVAITIENRYISVIQHRN